ncbi:MAG: formate dehydrogenase accessory sulfurtransferase FdhD [Thermodesulfobacteriota bacterium]
MNVIQMNALHWSGESDQTQTIDLLAEEPLSIRIQGKPYAVVMRTPGDEIPHVAGFCLTEGIVDHSGDIQNIAFCDGQDTNVVTVTLKPESQHRIPRIMERRGFISQTSCGICGKELIRDIGQDVASLTDEFRMDIRQAAAVLRDIAAHQPLRGITRAAHGAVIYDAGGNPLSAAEDVGRHNALDKAIGRLFLEQRLDRAVLLTLSSRVSYELVQKAARARIPILLALSRPTALAVSLAGSLGVTVACHDKAEGLLVFSGRQRLVRSNAKDP